MPKNELEGNIKMDVTEIGCKGVHRILLLRILSYVRKFWIL